MRITLSYDEWNRLTQKTYADGTPTAYFCYDGLTTSGGPCTGTRLAASIGYQTGFGNSISWTGQSVDSKGRVTSSTQTTRLADNSTRTDSFEKRGQAPNSANTAKLKPVPVFRIGTSLN